MKNWKLRIFMAIIAFLGIIIFTNCSGDGEDNEFTVTFDLDGGNIDNITTSVQITVKSGKTIDNLPMPQKEDNIFGGWYSKKNGFGNKFTSETLITSNKIVFARWGEYVTDKAGNCIPIYLKDVSVSNEDFKTSVDNMKDAYNSASLDLFRDIISGKINEIWIFAGDVYSFDVETGNFEAGTNWDMDDYIDILLYVVIPAIKGE
jgi:hypothetical protein